MRIKPEIGACVKTSEFIYEMIDGGDYNDFYDDKKKVRRKIEKKNEWMNEWRIQILMLLQLLLLLIIIIIINAKQGWSECERRSVKIVQEIKIWLYYQKVYAQTTARHIKLSGILEIRTDQLIPARVPDLVLINKKKKKKEICYRVHFAVLGDHRLEIKKKWKHRQIRRLCQRTK